jgi:peptidoglycan/xylan/chitin deacetylase (PgdA/CDA1 family)
MLFGFLDSPRLAWRAWCALAVVAAIAGCGGSDGDEEPAPRTPAPAPEVALTAEEREVWAPAPADHSSIPVLLYHGVAPASGFSHPADAEYGLDPDDFAKQMTLLKHAGYQTITLDRFGRFVRGEDVRLPPRPLLLTFDDGRADSWTGGDGILRELGFNAVMFVDVGAVDRGDSEYLTWTELGTVERSDRWELQLHSGEGHQQIRYGPGDDDFGPYYAYREGDESFEGWRDRAFGDITWGREELTENVPGVPALAFAPPFGNYGQEGTNDERIPGTLLGWLLDRYAIVFTQDRSPIASPGDGQPLGRLQVTRGLSAGDLHAAIAP